MNRLLLEKTHTHTHMLKRGQDSSQVDAIAFRKLHIHWCNVTAHKMYRPPSHQHMIFVLHSPFTTVIVSVRFTNLLFPDRTYVLTDVIILAQRRKTDDLSSKLKLKNCFVFFFSGWGWVGERGQLLILHSAPYFSLQLHYNSGLHSLILWKFVFREGRKIVL